MSDSIVEVIRKVAEGEVRKVHFVELGIVTSVFPHSSSGDKDNYECNVRLRDKDVELRKVLVATGHIGFAHIPHVGDLVLVTFINGDINSPVIIGRLYNDEDRPPTSKEEEIIYKPPYDKDKNLRRLNVTLPEETVTITVYDDRISVATGKSSFDMNEKGLIDMQAKPDGKLCQLTLDNKGIRVDTEMDIKVHSRGKMTVECEGDITFKAPNITMESQMALKFKAGTTADMESTSTTIQGSATTTIKGGIVKIN